MSRPKHHEPGLHPGVSMRLYLETPAVSHHALEVLRSKSPLHYQAAQRIPPKVTESMEQGTIAHVAVFERERFMQDALPLPAINPDTGNAWRKGTKADKRFREENPDRLIMKPDHYHAARRIGDAVRQHPVARQLLQRGRPELMIVWRCPHTGMLRRGRLDLLIDSDCVLQGHPRACRVVELKSCDSIDPWIFIGTAARLGYHRQLAGYVEGLEQLGYSVLDVQIIAVEQEEPHDCCVFPLPDYVLEAGRLDNKLSVGMLQRCRDTGVWPGKVPGGVHELDYLGHSKAKWELPYELREELELSGAGPKVDFGDIPK